MLNEVNVAKSIKGKQTVQYKRLKRYDILNIGEEKFSAIICRKKQKSCTMLLLT